MPPLCFLKQPLFGVLRLCHFGINCSDSWEGNLHKVTHDRLVVNSGIALGYPLALQGVKLLGVSCDDTDSHNAWSKDVQSPTIRDVQTGCIWYRLGWNMGPCSLTWQ